MWDWIDGIINGDEIAKLSEVKKILVDYVDYLSYQDVFSMVINTLVWGIIKCFYNLNTFLEATIYHSFDLKSLLHLKVIDTMYADIVTKILGILCVVTLMYLGIKFAVSKHPPKAKNIAVNLFMAMILIFGGGAMIDDVITLSQSSYGGFASSNKSDSQAPPSFELIKDNVYDLQTIMTTSPKRLPDLPSNQRNALTKTNFKYTNINAVMTPDQAKKIAGTQKDTTLKKRYESLMYHMDLNDKGEQTPVKIDDSGLAKYFYTSGYRRYLTRPGIILAGEMSLAFSYVFILFTIVICLFELVYKKFYLGFAAATDLETGQRMKTAIEDITQTLLLLAFTGLELRIYVKLVGGLADIHAKGTISPFLYVISLICLTIALFKGSQVVTKIFGIDTSVKQGGRTLLSAFALGSLLKSGVNGTKEGAGAAKEGLGKLNKMRKSAFSNQAKETNPEAPSSEEAPGAVNYPKKLSDVFNQAKAGTKGALKAAGYIDDLADKAKETAKESLEGTRAGDIGKKAKELVTDPKESAEKLKEKVGEMKDQIGKTYEEGQLSALEKNLTGNSLKKEQEENEGDSPKTRAAHDLTDPHQEQIDPTKVERKLKAAGLKEAEKELPEAADPAAGSKESERNQEDSKKERTVTQSLGKNSLDAQQPRTNPEKTLTGEAKVGKTIKENERLTVQKKSQKETHVTHSGDEGLDPAVSTQLQETHVTKRVDVKQLFAEANTHATLSPSKEVQQKNVEVKSLLNQSKKPKS
ncbi:pLS20_p028 family conjugation system transmembrane protein [Enterococcus gilvus]|uniref:pLS20_p028 family conjugation system transmembrane protein n=1 Tax=Enterococcus gilvus TaxID=160453 RepID=UPI003ED9DACB